MSYCVDANILLYASDPSSDRHERARRFTVVIRRAQFSRCRSHRGHPRESGGPEKHPRSVGSQFTTKYGVKMLVWFEHYRDVRDAITREKQLKKWERRWKLELIERFNPDWRDLYETLNN